MAERIYKPVDSYRDVVSIFLSDVGGFMEKGDNERFRAYIDGNGLLNVQTKAGEKTVTLLTVKGNFIVEWEVE